MTWLLFITDVRMNGQRVEYLIERFGNVPPIVVPSVVAMQKWPKLIFDYLENNIRFDECTETGLDISEANSVSGLPIKITYVTNVSDFWKYQYWCEYPLQKKKFVASADCTEKWPRLVLAYLESKLQIIDRRCGRMSKCRFLKFNTSSTKTILIYSIYSHVNNAAWQLNLRRCTVYPFNAKKILTKY